MTERLKELKVRLVMQTKDPGKTRRTMTVLLNVTGEIAPDQAHGVAGPPQEA